MASKTLEVKMATGNQQRVYANIHHEFGDFNPWELCTMKSDTQTNASHQIVVVDKKNVEHKLPHHFVATENIPDPLIKPQTRIIARKQHRFLPFYLKGADLSFPVQQFDETIFFAGIISNVFGRSIDGHLEYLVFFDDGHAQYVPQTDIRVVNGNHGIKFVSDSIRSFYNYYFSVERECRPRVYFPVNSIIRVSLNGRFQDAVVGRFIGHHMIMIVFINEKRIEFIHTESPRIEVISKSIEQFEKHACKKLTHGKNMIVVESRSPHLVAMDIHKRENKTGCSSMGTIMHKESPLCIRTERKNSIARKECSARGVARDSNRIPCDDAKKAIEFLVILAEIRHEMNRAGLGGKRIELYAENPLNGREPIWKRICHFLCTQGNQQNRSELKKLIQHFTRIDAEFRNTYDHYVKPKSTVTNQVPVATDPKNIEKNPEKIQQEVTLKIQSMQKYLESRTNGDADVPSVNLVQYLDEVINEFSKLTE